MGRSVEESTVDGDAQAATISRTTISGNTATRTNAIGNANASSGGLHLDVDPSNISLSNDVITGTKRLIEAYIAQPAPPPATDPNGLDELSARELEILHQVAQGHTNREIADALHLSPLTVKTHVSRILTKLNARDRVQLVVIAYQAGIAPH